MSSIDECPQPTDIQAGIGCKHCGKKDCVEQWGFCRRCGEYQ